MISQLNGRDCGLASKLVSKLYDSVSDTISRSSSVFSAADGGEGVDFRLKATLKQQRKLFRVRSPDLIGQYGIWDRQEIKGAGAVLNDTCIPNVMFTRRAHLSCFSN